MSSTLRVLLTVLVAWTGHVAIADAQDQMPPQRAGRVSIIDGRMTVKGADEQDWSQAEVNYPVAPGMSFATAPGSRAEMQFGGTAIRMDGRTEISILALDDNTTAISVDDGSVDVRPRMLFDDEHVDVESARTRVSIVKPGAYRIDAGVGNEPTHIVVFQGRAEIETPRGREVLEGGSALETNPAGQVRRVPVDASPLDDWAEARERVLASSQSQQYVGEGTPGYQDLDQNGTWQETGDYGPVWYPTTVGYDWEPYAYGQWTWVAPWGWTWVDDQPWGFAPFHYGRWVYVGGRWGWCPGERIRHPVYAPALVGFVGSDPWRFRSRTVRPDHWVPLAPGEVYQAPYSRNAGYLRALNRGNVRHDAVDRFDWQARHQNDFANDHHIHPVTQNGWTGARPDRRGPIGVTDPARGREDHGFPRPNTFAPNAAAPTNPGVPDGGRPQWRGGAGWSRGPQEAAPAAPGGNAPADNQPRHDWRGAQGAVPAQGGAVPNAQPQTSAPVGNGDRHPGWQGRVPQATPQPGVGIPQTDGAGRTNLNGRANWGTPQGSAPPAPNFAAPAAAPPFARPNMAPPQQIVHPHQPQDQNTGQNNTGQGNTGQGNTGQGNTGGPPPGGGWRGR